MLHGGKCEKQSKNTRSSCRIRSRHDQCCDYHLPQFRRIFELDGTPFHNNRAHQEHCDRKRHARAHCTRRQNNQDVNSEVFGLRWRWVDFERRLLHIRERIYEGVYDTPKGRPQSIPMSDLVYSVLRTRHTSSAYTTPDGLVFCREDGRPLNPRTLLKEHIYPTCEHLGLPRVGWHELRHTFSTHLDRSGASPKTMQSLLRHSKVETTLNVYTHAGLEEQRKAVAKLEQVLFPTVPNFASGSELTH